MMRSTRRDEIAEQRSQTLSASEGNRAEQRDWDAVEAEYRSTALPVREIARRHRCSTSAVYRKAKLCGWRRDAPRPPGEAPPTGAQLVRRVRHDLVRLREIAERLTNDLGADESEEAHPETGVLGRAQADSRSEPTTVRTRAQALDLLTRIAERLVDLERKVADLEELYGNDDEADADAIRREIERKLARIAAEPEANPVPSEPVAS